MGIPAEDVDAALEGVGAPTAARSALTFEQFVSVVRKLDEAEEVDDEEDEEEEEEEEGDEELDLDFDGENMTPGENEEMLRILFNTINGKKKTMPMKTFLAWDDVKDMQKEGVLDKETLDIFLEEVGVKKGAELTQDQFVALVTMMDENMRAVAGGAAEDDNAPGATLGEGEDDESSPEIDSEELEAVAREIYDELRGKSKALSVKAFRKWEEVQEAVKAGILSENTLDVLVKEVASPGATELTFDEFQQLVGLLDQVADAALGATAEDSSGLKGQPSSSSSSSSVPAKAKGKGKGKQQAQEEDEDEEDDTVFEMDEDDLDEPTPEELEAFAKEIFDELKSAKTNKVTIKAFKAWEGVKDVLESGELSKEDLATVIAEVDKDNTGSLSFDQFRKVMDKVEGILNEGADFEDDEEEEEEVVVAVSAKGKGKASSAAAAAAVVSGQGFGRESTGSSDGKKGKGKASPSPAAVEDEALEVATEIFDELRGKKKTLSVKTFKEWEDTRDLVDSGALKRSTLEKGIVKVGAYESGEMTLTQFVALVDYIQASIDDSSLSLGEFDEEGDGESASRIPTSKASKVLRLQDQDEDDELGDDDEDWDGQGGEGEEELSEEEQAKQAFDDLREGRASLPLVDFLKWEDVQELLECGALSKDNLAMAIENAGLTVDKGEISFEKVRVRVWMQKALPFIHSWPQPH
jgi:Ca2+-binding EF-hand superfamily protein